MPRIELALIIIGVFVLILLATESIGRHHAALVSKSVNRQMGLSHKEQKKTIYE